jgi:hypothetical protein
MPGSIPLGIHHHLQLPEEGRRVLHLVQNDRRAMPLQEEGGILLRLLGLAQQVEGDKAVVRKEPPKG